MKATSLLLLAIYSALKQHFHPGYLSNFAISSRGFTKIILRQFSLAILTNRHHIIDHKRVLDKHFPLAYYRLIELIIVDRSLVKCANRLYGFHFLIQQSRIAMKTLGLVVMSGHFLF